MEFKREGIRFLTDNYWNEPNVLSLHRMYSLLDSPSVLKAQKVQTFRVMSFTVLDLRIAELITLRGLLNLVVISGALITNL